jgi:sarcosine oxidase subunit gamma
VTAESSLAHRAADLATIGGVEVPLLAQVDLRVRIDAEVALSLSLPTEPDTVLMVGDRSILWLGPDEWLVTSGVETAAAIVGELETAPSDRHRAVTDVSANRAVVDLTGAGALDLLATGCSLDLHPTRWHTGMCAQTLFARASVILEQREHATRIFIRPSFADYLVDRLLAAAPAP